MPSLGLLHAILSAATYGLMSFLVHWNPSRHPVEQMLFLRGLLTILVVLPFCAKDVHKYFGPASLSLWVRALAGAGGVFCYFYSLQGTASANANVVFSSSPIFVALFGWLLFRERLSRTELLGVAAIVFGNFLLYWPNRSATPLWVWLTGTAGAVFASVAYLSLGAATKKHSVSLIVLGFAVASTAFAFFLPGGAWLPLSLDDALFLAAIAFLGLASQVTATLSFVHLKSSVATAIGRSSILFSGILDIAIAHYRPHVLEWASYLVVLAGVYLAHEKRKKAPKPVNAGV